MHSNKNPSKFINTLLKAKLSIANAGNHFKRYGLLSFIKTSFTHLGFQFFDNTLIFFVRDLETLKNSIRQDYSFSAFSVEDIESGRYDYDDGFFNKRKAIYRLKLGHRLYVVKIDNKLASYLWVEQVGATVWWFNDLPVNMPKNMAYISAEYTPPEFRNKGIAPRMQSEILHYLKENGIRRVIAVVHPKNTISLKLQKWLGFRDYQVIRYRRFWLIRYYMITKTDSSESKKVITLFRSPKSIWRTYLPSNQTEL